MGSADEGTDIRVELDEVALQRLQSGDPCLMPCVDCGLVTKKFCDLCWGEDHFPQDKWAYGRLIPLCSRCNLMYLQCHFCRGMDWCVPAPHSYRSIQTSYKYLPLSALHKEKQLVTVVHGDDFLTLSLIHISEPTRRRGIWVGGGGV